MNPNPNAPRRTPSKSAGTPSENQAASTPTPFRVARPAAKQDLNQKVTAIEAAQGDRHMRKTVLPTARKANVGTPGAGPVHPIPTGSSQPVRMEPRQAGKPTPSVQDFSAEYQQAIPVSEPEVKSKKMADASPLTWQPRPIGKEKKKLVEKVLREAAQEDPESALPAPKKTIREIEAGQSDPFETNLADGEGIGFGQMINRSASNRPKATAKPAAKPASAQQPVKAKAAQSPAPAAPKAAAPAVHATPAASPFKIAVAQPAVAASLEASPFKIAGKQAPAPAPAPAPVAPAKPAAPKFKVTAGYLPGAAPAPTAKPTPAPAPARVAPTPAAPAVAVRPAAPSQPAQPVQPVAAPQAAGENRPMSPFYIATQARKRPTTSQPTVALPPVDAPPVAVAPAAAPAQAALPRRASSSVAFGSLRSVGESGPELKDTGDVEESLAEMARRPSQPARFSSKNVKFNCPCCYHGVSLPKKLAGQKARCPQCDSAIRAPHPKRRLSAYSYERHIESLLHPDHFILASSIRPTVLGIPLPNGQQVLMGGAAAIFLSGGVAAMKMGSGQRPLESTPSTAITAVEQKSSEQLQREAEAVVRNFLKADGWQAKAAFVRDAERVTPLMEKHYSKYPGGEALEPTRVLSSAPTFYASQQMKQQVSTVRAEFATNEYVTYRVEFIDGEAQVEWEASVAYNPKSWDEIVADEHNTEPQLVRVAAAVDTYWNYQFKDDHEYLSVHLSDPITKQPLGNGYIARHSEEAVRLRTFLGSASKRRPEQLMLKIRPVAGAKERRMVEIVEFVKGGFRNVEDTSVAMTTASAKDSEQATQ